MAGTIVFLSFAPRDDGLRQELENHLAPLKRDGHICAWHTRLIELGEEPRRRVEEQLRAAHIVVLLVSPDYVANDIIHAEEVLPTLARVRKGSALVIPVIVRPLDLQATPFFKLSCLPRNGVAVTSWPNRDEAWTDVAAGLREAVVKMSGNEAAPRHKANTAPPAPRHEDAESRSIATAIEGAYRRRLALVELGEPTAAVDAEILNLRRRLRDGGMLRAGDALGDGRYRLIKPLGRGGFATVWSAFDRERRERVAVKVLHSDLARDPQRRERFFRGARVMARLGHESVVRVLCEQGEDGGFLYFVMEFMTGGDLHHAVIKGEVVPKRAIRIILSIGEALSEAHAKGIVHRDVKPANILLDEAREPRLTDFDLVAVGDTTGGTRTGALGTYLFAAPEQMHNAKDVDARADVYSLGMTAVFALYGKGLPAIVTRRPEEVIAALSCNKDVKDVLKRATAFEPDDRFADARAFSESLRKAGRITLKPSTRSVRPPQSDLDVFEGLARKASRSKLPPGTPVR
ncbi:hypothetical protein BE18_09435 [Sorangium cellulosum]|uniref:Uncharacterized protein n=1 Tax=Sorangium cellulosum TaxID=56 RepID=A0A150REX6_SORCE|nr:hypothetical protein BE18_09435 [Sorangium cellulosum]